MADSRKQYTVTINGIEHELLLDPQDAENLYGENAVESKAKTPANKQADAPANKSA